jgi:hypothetical protein
VTRQQKKMNKNITRFYPHLDCKIFTFLALTI